MSHFTVMVIGAAPEKQLEPYSEHIEMPEYASSLVEQSDIETFVQHYESKWKELGNDVNIQFVDGKVSGNFMDVYAKFGRDWNGLSWRQHTDGTWWEYSSYNPKSKWDWYKLGGRWTGYFKVRNGAKKAKAGSPGLMTSPAKPGYADQLLKGDIDLDAMYNEAADEAAKEYDSVMVVLGQLPANKPWSDFHPTVGKPTNEDWERARHDYGEQERVKAYRDKAKENIEAKESFFHIMGSPDAYLLSREEFIGRAMKNTIVPFAVVRDGKWYERGEMGWWGVVSNEKDKDQWMDEVHKMMASLPDKTLVSLFDCHI